MENLGQEEVGGQGGANVTCGEVWSGMWGSHTIPWLGGIQPGDLCPFLEYVWAKRLLLTVLHHDLVSLSSKDPAKVSVWRGG